MLNCLQTGFYFTNACVKEKLDFAPGVSLVFERKTLHNLYRINGTAVKPIEKQQQQQNNSKIPIKRRCLKTRAPMNDEAKN